MSPPSTLRTAPRTSPSSSNRPRASLLKRIAIPVSVVAIVVTSATLYRSALQKRALDKRSARKDYPNPL
ncbi:hypothetical protein JCM3766R1_006227 [Sporobolomyces carnicolor]